MTHRWIGWRTWLALPLAVSGLLAAQALVATSATAGIVFVRSFETTGNGALHSPEAVTTDELGNVFVADTGMQRIVEFNHIGEYVREFGDGSSTTAGTDGHVYYPAGITYFNKLILVADTGGNDVQIFDDNGSFQTRWSSSGPLQFNAPDGIAVDCAGHVYVTNSRGPDGAGNIVELDRAGHYLTEFGHANLAVPVGIAVDSSGGNGSPCVIGRTFVADEYNGRIAVFNADGTFDKYVGSQGQGPMQFDHPDEIALERLPDGRDVLWIAESGNFRVQALISSDAGATWSELGIIDQGPGGHLNDTHGVAVNGEGHIIVAQTEGSQVFEYDNEAPHLYLRFLALNKSHTKQTSGIWVAVRYNQLDKSCKVLVKATLSAAGHTFTDEQDAADVTDNGSEVKVDLSSRQLKWMQQAWQAGHNVPVSAKALGSCSDNVHLTVSETATIKH